MCITLQPMTDGVFQTYLSDHEEEYARDRMITDQETFEEALRTTQSQHQAMIPEGLNTPGHYFFSIKEERRGLPVGYVWLACRQSGGDMFLYHIFIKPAERRKGYGRLALQAIEEKSKELGCRAIWLNVMAHNQGAIDFYHANGYRSATVHMSKHFNGGR